MLPDFESYQDPVAYFNAKDLAEEGGAFGPPDGKGVERPGRAW
jgi:hypothetical protein